MKTFSTDEHDNGDCDYAAIEVDSEYLARLRRMRDTTARVAQEWNDSLCCVQFYDEEACFYAADDLGNLRDETVTQHLEDRGYAVLPGNPGLTSIEPRRTGGQCVVAQVRFGECNFCWSCYPEHTESIKVESTVAPLTWIEEALATARSDGVCRLPKA